MNTERCPRCNGPVEIHYHAAASDPDCRLFKGYRALPDTLEEIEAYDKWKHDDVRRWKTEDNTPWEDACRRIFNGCASCGREPMLNFWKHKTILKEVQRLTECTSFHQAADELEQLRPNLIGQASKACKNLIRKFRRIAEGE